MRLQQPFRWADFSGGQANNVNPNLLPQQCCELGLNVDFDSEIGSAVTRLGTAIRGAQLVAGNSILGLFQHVDTANSTNNKLFATINASGGATSVIYDVVAGSTSQTGLTASKKMRFLTFLGTTLAINGADAERSYTSGGWVTSGGNLDVANIPSSNTVNLCTEFLDRVYVAGDTAKPTRLYYSGLSDGSTISWTVGNGYVDVDAGNDNGPITALARVPGYVLVFKERALTRWDFNSAYPEQLVNYGTPSQESVVQGGGLVAFYSNSNENDKGFFITNGGRPTPISHDTTRPIKKWIDAISTSNEANIAGFATNHGFKWSVGDLTVDGETYNNVWLCYNRLLNQWSVRSYPSEFKVFARELVSGVNTIVGGDDAGTVYRVDKSGTYSDNGTAIAYKLRTKSTDFGFSQLKSVSDRAILRGKNLAGASIAAIPDEDLTAIVQIPPQTPIRKLLSLFGFGNKATGTTISIEVSGTVLNNQAIIREIELPVVEIEQSYV